MKKLLLFLSMFAVVFATSCDETTDDGSGSDVEGSTGFVEDKSGYVESMLITYDGYPDESDTFTFEYDDYGRITTITLKSIWYSGDSVGSVVDDVEVYDDSELAQATKSISEEDVKNIVKGKIPTALLPHRNSKSSAVTRSTSGTLREETSQLILEYGANSILMTTMEDGEVEETATAILNSNGAITEIAYGGSEEGSWESNGETITSEFTYSGTISYTYDNGYLSSSEDVFSYEETQSDGSAWSGSSIDMYSYTWTSGNLTSVMNYDYDEEDGYSLMTTLTNSYGSELNDLSVDVSGFLLEVSEWLSGLEKGLLGETSTNLVAKSVKSGSWGYYSVSEFDYTYNDGALTLIDYYYASDNIMPSDLELEMTIALTYY